jgi:peptidoglycan/LPS O-acetylase OafA/YrhL
MVMEFHLWGLAFSIGSQVPTLAIDQWVARITGMGWSGVDLFFVLSGFLITGILYDTKKSNGFLRTFYARRFLRLAPVYYLFLLFVLLVVPYIEPINAVAQVDELRDIQWWMWLYAINIGEAVRSFDAPLPVTHIHFWSLAVEEQFYLVWPFAVLALPRRPLMGLCCLMIVAALAFRVALTEGMYDNVFAGNARYVLMPARMDTLALGALIALAARGTELPAMARAAPVIAALAVTFLTLLFIKNDGLSPWHTDVARLGFTAFAVLFAALLVIVLHTKEGSLLYRGLTLAPLRAFGKYSYAIYVFHLLTAFVLARAFILNDWTPTLQGSQIPVNIIFSIVASATSLGLAWVSWQLVEQPLLQLKKRLPYRERSSSPLVAPTAAGELR